MTSVLSNRPASFALEALSGLTKDLNVIQGRISTGLRELRQGYAAYFSISESLSCDRTDYSAVSEGLTLTKNAIVSARTASETIVELTEQFQERIADGQNVNG